MSDQPAPPSAPPAGPGTPPRSLRNEIAHALMEGHDWTVREMRRAIEAAQIAVDTVGAFVLVNDVTALLDELGV